DYGDAQPAARATDGPRHPHLRRQARCVNDVMDQASLLENLSEADKDALIMRLWRDLQEERARSRELERRMVPGTLDRAEDVREASPLLRRLQKAGAGKRVPAKVPGGLQLGLGRCFAFLRARRLIAALGIVVLAFVLDFAVGCYEQYRLEQKRLAAL